MQIFLIELELGRSSSTSAVDQHNAHIDNDDATRSFWNLPSLQRKTVRLPT
jgi:hypothetical protein